MKRLKPKRAPHNGRPLTVWLSGLAGTVLAITLVIFSSNKSAANVSTTLNVGTVSERSLAKEALQWHRLSADNAPVTTTSLPPTTRVLVRRTTTTSRPIPPPMTAHVSAQSAKVFIYNHESGNNPTSRAGNGACGLGQALPCSKLPCPLTVEGYGCQDAWFTNYAISRYGSWEAARMKWIERARWSETRQDWFGGWW